ncbi:MAG: FliI/YscN family ATPase [Aestuariivirga sp.]
MSSFAARLHRLHDTVAMAEATGKVVEATASGFQIQGLSNFVKLGSLVKFHCGKRPVLAEVVRVERDTVLVRTFDNGSNISLATQVSPFGNLTIRPSPSWKGRMIDALGRPIDGGGELVSGQESFSVDNAPPNAMVRALVQTPVRTGVRVMDIFTPLCKGQRIGIFAGSGVGKSTILSMLSRAAGFDTVIVILVGERGREVREFAESTLGKDKHRLVSVVATGDESPMMRRLAPRTGMRLAEYFRDQGENVLLIMDSVTRYAHACRDVALSAGEAPVARGFPPSIFSDLPQLLERAGPGSEGKGFITGIFSVLVDGDDHNDPVADAIRGTLDGHIVLSRNIAEQGRYPAVNLLASISRLAQLVWTPEQRKLVRMLLALIARFEDSRDLRAMGGYLAGGDVELDKALSIVPKLYQALAQTPDSAVSLDPFAEVATQLAE